MKITSVVIAIITTTNAVWGATIKSHARHVHGGNHTSRAHAGKRTATNCPTSGFHPSGQASCVCNFAGACTPGTTTHTTTASNDLTNLAGIAPRGLDMLAYGTQNLGTVCEGGVVAALYDCNARTSLYAATVIDGPNANARGARRDCWKGTTDLNLIKHPNLLPTHDDYKDSSQHIYCYEDSNKQEFEWDGVATCSASSLPMKIHKGHLIAARYGHTHGNPDATFTYTNAVPQEGPFNSGKWRSSEATVTNMAVSCQTNAAAKPVKVYVVVGVIPSTFLGKPRFFGSPGFGEFQGASKLSSSNKEFRISFPEIMWTAACCVANDGSVQEKLAFWRRNYPKKDMVNSFTSTLQMFMDMQAEIRRIWGKSFTIPTIFPAVNDCNL